MAMRTLVAVAGLHLTGLVLAASSIARPWLGGAPGTRVALAVTSLGLSTLGLLLVATRGDVSQRWQRLAAIIAALAALAAGLGHQPIPPRPDLRGGISRLRARVERTGCDHRGSWSDVRVLEGYRIEDRWPVRQGTRLRLRSWGSRTEATPARGRSSAGDTVGRLHAGDQMRALVRISPYQRFRNDSPHPRWPMPSQLDGRGTLVSGAAIDHRDRWAAGLDDLRDRVRGALDRTLSARTAGLARAVIVGDGGLVEASDQESLRDAGLAHVMAVSGLHVSLLAGLWVVLLGSLLRRIPLLSRRWDTRRLAAWGGPPAAIGYALFVGSPPSALRAATMASIAFLLFAIGRRPRPLSLVAATALLLAAISPDQVVRPAFILSIAATAAIVTTRLPMRGTWAGVRLAAAVAVRSTGATGPGVLWCFGGVPAVGIAANLLILPLASMVLLPLLVGLAVLATIATSLGSISAPIVDAVGVAFLEATALMARMPSGHHLPPPSLLQGIILATGVSAWLVLRRPRMRWLVIALATVAVIGAEVVLRIDECPTESLRITFLDVGQGDAMLVDLPDGRLMLVDAGGAGPGAPNPGRDVIVPLLAARRRQRIDIAVITHPHPDHFGGLESIAAEVPVAELWISGQALSERPQEHFAKLVRHLERHGTVVRDANELCAMAEAQLGATIEVLWPCPGYDGGYEPNDNSLVLRVHHGGKRILLVGDIEAHAETSLMASAGDLRAELLKVGHHGSRTSSAAAFLARVSPKLAIISAGNGNRFGHPHAEIVQRLEASGARVMRTDRQGGVTVSISESGGVRVRTWQDGYSD